MKNMKHIPHAQMYWPKEYFSTHCKDTSLKDIFCTISNAQYYRVHGELIK